MFPVTKPQPYASASLLTSTADTETRVSVAAMKVCRVCLAINVRMYHMSEHKLSIMYEKVTGVEINSKDELPKMLCWECVARLSSANHFVEKALKTQWIWVNKVCSKRFVAMTDIESIDRTHYQLQSTLGFKYNKENDADLYILTESDKINDPFGIENYKYEDSKANICEINNIQISNEEEQLVSKELNVIDNIDQIKEEYIEESEEQIVSDEEYKRDTSYENDEIQTFEIVKEENISDRAIELGIDNVLNVSVKSEVYHDAEEVCVDGVIPLMNGSEASPRCKDLSVVVEDVMVISSNQNSQDDIKQLAAQSSKDAVPPTGHHLKVKLKNKRSSKNVFICDICNKPFHLKHSLTRHLKKHPKMQRCTYCSYTAYDWKVIKEHIRCEHPKNCSFNCSFCSYKTDNKSNYTNHVNSKHTQADVYQCSLCSYKAFRKSSLAIHINAKHTKTDVYNCSLCTYKTYDKSSLRRHVRVIHTKANVYNCSLCSYKAYDKCTLTRHVSIKHTNTNVYNCSFCGYTFYDKSAFNIHVNVQHTKSVSYDCTLCSYKTYHPRALPNHVKAKHNKTIYNCSHCSYKTYRQGTLAKHVNAKHTESLQLQNT